MLRACVFSPFVHVWLFWDPVNCSPPGSSVHGILQARILEWVAMPSSRGSSWPRDWFSSLVFLDYISPFNIYCKAGLVVLNSLNFCLPEKLFISPSILNEILAWYCNLGCRFFPFNTLNISCQSLLACRVSAEKSADSLKEIPLYVMLFVVASSCCF